MRNVIITTDYCYEGYDTVEECYVIDTYSNLSDNENIQESSIEWSSETWDDEKDYFKSFIEDEIKKKEKSSGSNVVALGQIGRVGLWNGSPTGGRVYDTDQIKKLLEMDVDTIEVTVDENNIITIEGHHHDGTHRMNIYLITEKELKKTKILDVYEDEGIEGLNDVSIIQKIYDNLETLKLKGTNYYVVD